MNLILPDTDTLLSTTATTDSPRFLSQEICLPTSWASEPEQLLRISYRHSDTGWSALLQRINPSAKPLEDSAESARSAAAKALFLANEAAAIQLDAPVALQPVFIAKPWGREIWFSGIEARGESQVTQGAASLPLSHYLALAPERLTRRTPPLLLKILDPNTEPGRGSLYFETHNTKREVYVVTHVDRTAWPGGVGAIKLGMNQQLRSQFSDDHAFRAAYLAAVKRYEIVRRAIDAQSTRPSSDQPADQASALAESGLAEREQTARETMEQFIAVQPLSQGDVVQVLPQVPHSLQHGVRVFEFQTPTYERNIISFNQQVLTQDHWDSEYAISNMTLDPPPAAALEVLQNTADVSAERIVSFDEFTVVRLRIAANGSSPLPEHNSCTMLAIISGTVTISTAAGQLELTAGEPEASSALAALIPASASRCELRAGRTGTTLLLATPNPQLAGTIPAIPAQAAEVANQSSAQPSGETPT